MDEFGFKVRRGTAEDWETYLANYYDKYGEEYVPAEGKLLAVGFVNEDNNTFFKLKVGNGVTPFNELPFTDKIDDTGVTIEDIINMLDEKQGKLTPGPGITIEAGTGNNLFNIEDKYIGYLNTFGVLVDDESDSSNFITSDFIPVAESSSYTVSCNYKTFDKIGVALYDEYKNFVSYESDTGTSRNNNFQYYRFNTTQEGYVRFTVLSTNTNIMLNKGHTYLPYEEYVELENVISAVGGSGDIIDYHEQVTNKPTINNVEIDGDLTSDDLGLLPKREWEIILTQDISDSSTSDYYDFNIFTDINDEYKKIRIRLTMESNTTGHMSSSSNAIYIDNYMIASSNCPAGASLEEHKGLDTYVIFDFENCVCTNDVGLITTNNIKHNNTKVSVFPKMNNNKQLGLQIYNAYPLVFDNATLIVEGMRW